MAWSPLQQETGIFSYENPVPLYLKHLPPAKYWCSLAWWRVFSDTCAWTWAISSWCSLYSLANRPVKIFRPDGVSYIFGNFIFNYLRQEISNRDIQRTMWLMGELETAVGSGACLCIVIATGTTPVCASEGKCLVFSALPLRWPQAFLHNPSVRDGFTGCLQNQGSNYLCQKDHCTWFSN